MGVYPIRRALHVPTKGDARTIMGVTGLKHWGGVLMEEFLTELQGARGRRVYREMAANDPVVKRGLRAIKWQLLSAKWTAEGGEGPDAEKGRGFLQSCIDDMSDSWMETLEEGLTCLDYGWSWAQVVYKQRMGPNQKDGARRSKYDDGLLAWRKWSFRGQETLERWTFDEEGGVQGLVQRDPNSGKLYPVPIDLSLHFKLGGRLGDPEGESLLRSAYVPFYYCKRLRDIEAIGAERNLAGMAVIQVQPDGPDVFAENNPNMEALFAYLQQVVTTVRVDEQMGAVLPPGVEMKLLSPGGAQFDTDKIIRRYSWEILGSMLAQFLELGQSAHGSYGKTIADKNFFLTAAEGILQNVIAAVINRFEVPRLFRLNANAFRLDEYPRLVPSDIRVPYLDDIAEPLAKLIQAGAIGPYPELEAWLLQQGHMPERPEEDTEAGPDIAQPREPTDAARKAAEDVLSEYTLEDIVHGH